MRFFSVLLLSLLICLVECAKKKSAHKTTPKDSKTTNPSKSTSASDKRTSGEIIGEKLQISPLLTLGDGNFTKFVVDRPRDYRAILMFTATDPRYQCGICSRAKKAFYEVAKLYHEQYNFSEVDPSQRVAFFALEVDGARSIFSDLALETVPKLFSLPPAKTGDPRNNIHDYEIEGRPFMEGIHASLQHVNENTKLQIQVLTDPLPLLIGTSLFALLLALFATVAWFDLGTAFLFYQNSKIWVVVSILCFAVGVSGSIYCIIRSAPPFGYNRQGSLSLFAAQGRDQFLLEGIIVSLWTIGCGLSCFIMYRASKIRFPIVSHVGVLFGMTVFIVLALQLWGAYGTKTAWYSLRETLPADVWQFLRSSVKKDSNIFKRILRLSDIWLNEVKDFDGFKKKFDALVVEYLKRIVAGGVAK